MRSVEIPSLNHAADALPWIEMVARYRGERRYPQRCPTLPAERGAVGRLPAPESLRLAWRAGLRPYHSELLPPSPSSTTFAEMRALQRQNMTMKRTHAAAMMIRAEAGRPALVQLPQGGDTLNLLFMAAADRHGEYPILGVSLDGDIFVKYASVAHYLVEYLASELPPEIRLHTTSDAIFASEFANVQNRVRRALLAEPEASAGLITRELEHPRAKPARLAVNPSVGGSREAKAFLTASKKGTPTLVQREAARAAAGSLDPEKTAKFLLECWRVWSVDKAKSVDAFDVALRSSHAEPRFFSLYFTAAIEAGRAREALPHIERALADNGPKQWVALQGALQVAGALSDRDLARRVLARAKELGCDTAGWLKRSEFASARRVLASGKSQSREPG